MKDRNPHIWLFSFILLITSAISIMLTGMFAYNLAESLNSLMMTVIFVSVGVVLDITKVFTPALAYETAKTSIWLSIILVMLTMLLIAISFTASFSAFESSITSHESESQEYQIIAKQIASLEAESVSLLKQIEKQRAITQVSNADRNQIKLSALNEKISAMYNKQLNLNQESTISKWGSELILILSLTLEVITLVSAMVIHHLRTVNFAVSTDIDKLSNLLTASTIAKYSRHIAENEQVGRLEPTQEFHSKIDLLERAAYLIRTNAMTLNQNDIAMKLDLNFPQSLLLEAELHSYLSENS